METDAELLRQVRAARAALRGLQRAARAALQAATALEERLDQVDPKPAAQPEEAQRVQ